MSETIASATVGISQETTAARPRASRFFLGMSIVLLAIVFVGFAPTLYLRAFFNLPEIPPHVLIHGAVLTSWYVWLVLQASCIAAKRTDLHRRLGIVGTALGVAVVVASAITTLRFGPRLAEGGVNIEARLHFLSEIVWVNIDLLICFSIFLSAAIVLRNRPQIHKRLMLLASISILAPAISRIIDWPLWGVGNNALFPLLCCLVVLLLALVLHDLKSQRSLHPVTLAGGAVIVALFVVSGFVLPNTQFGRSFVYALYQFML